MDTQDGYDWPTEHPAAATVQPMAPYFREQLQDVVVAEVRIPAGKYDAEGNPVPHHPV